MTLNLNRLPDLCLRTIFAQLPVPDLYRLHQVCLLWASLQPSVCAAVRTLSLFIGQPHDGYRFSQSHFPIPHLEQLSTELRRRYRFSIPHCQELTFSWLDGASLELISRLFPNVTAVKLSVYEKVPPATFDADYSILKQLTRLLSSWSASLETLHLQVKVHSTVQPELPQLVSSINALSRLQVFIFQSDNLSLEPFPTLSFSILGQLHEFYCDLNCYDDPYTRFYESLSQYGPSNPNLVKIGLGRINTFDLVDRFYSRHEPAFYGKFVSFPFLEFLRPDDEMARLCRKFYSVQSWDIIFHSKSELYQMAKLLEPNTNLLFLDMFANYNLETDDDVAAESQEEEQQQVSTPRPLPSVRILNIYCPTAPSSHKAFYDIAWHQLFPNLEILHFNDRYLECSICELPEREWTDSDVSTDEEEEDAAGSQFLEKVKYSTFRKMFRFDEHEKRRLECLRLAVQPWRQCSKLRVVYTGNNNTPKRWDLAQLWA